MYVRMYVFNAKCNFKYSQTLLYIYSVKEDLLIAHWDVENLLNLNKTKE